MRDYFSGGIRGAFFPFVPAPAPESLGGGAPLASAGWVGLGEEQPDRLATPKASATTSRTVFMT